ncbi:hypothetical protein BH23ACT10_BH23ACT10_32420 [soil metagenome]
MHTDRRGTNADRFEAPILKVAVVAVSAVFLLPYVVRNDVTRWATAEDGLIDWGTAIFYFAAAVIFVLASDRLDCLVLDETGVLTALGGSVTGQSLSMDVMGVQVLATARAVGLDAIVAPLVDGDDRWHSPRTLRPWARWATTASTAPHPGRRGERRRPTVHVTVGVTPLLCRTCPCNPQETVDLGYHKRIGGR